MVIKQLSKERSFLVLFILYSFFIILIECCIGHLLTNNNLKDISIFYWIIVSIYMCFSDGIIYRSDK